MFEFYVESHAYRYNIIYSHGIVTSYTYCTFAAPSFLEDYYTRTVQGCGASDGRYQCTSLRCNLPSLCTASQQVGLPALVIVVLPAIVSFTGLAQVRVTRVNIVATSVWCSGVVKYIIIELFRFGIVKNSKPFQIILIIIFHHIDNLSKNVYVLATYILEALIHDQIYIRNSKFFTFKFLRSNIFHSKLFTHQIQEFEVKLHEDKFNADKLLDILSLIF